MLITGFIFGISPTTKQVFFAFQAAWISNLMIECQNSMVGYKLECISWPLYLKDFLGYVNVSKRSIMCMHDLRKLEEYATHQQHHIYGAKLILKCSLH